jgi:titin
LDNTHDGIIISSGAQSNTIGGSTTGERNVISGNGRYGVNISGSTTKSNTVSGNHIGTNASGTANLGNTYDGVVIYSGAQNNTIGGSTPSKRNVISGNGWSGVGIFDNTTKGNIVSGNYIGTDTNGTVELGNTHNGVLISSGANNNTIGGSTPSGRNVISGNGWSGVGISGNDTKDNTISGNYIGTDTNGTVELSNTHDGVSISSGANNNIIGGSTPGDLNVISSNGSNGVNISGSAAGNIISGNYIGTDASGTLGLGNTSAGVSITDGAQNNIVGGNTPGERNIISDNSSYGVVINGSGTTGNTISGNYIGIDARGTVGLGNTQDGVKIYAGAQNNNIGPGNLIAYNGLDGVQIEGSITTGNTITQNSIFSNKKGIHLVNSANGGIPAPVIYAATLGSTNIVGNACSGCTVEVFENSDTDGEGETYIGSTTASVGGFFTLFVSSLSNPYLTATATDVISGTSEFSEMINWTERYIHLPLVLKNY